MACQVFDEITRVTCPREVILTLRIFLIFKLLLEQVTLKFTISHDSKMNLGMEYEKRMLKLMVDQKSTWLTLDFTDLGQNDPFSPFDQLNQFQSNLNLNFSILTA